MTAASRYREEDDSDTSCSSSDHDDEPSEECEDDRCNGPQPPVWHCVDCDSSYCRCVETRWSRTQCRVLMSLTVTAGDDKVPISPKRKAETACLTRRLTHTL